MKNVIHAAASKLKAPAGNQGGSCYYVTHVLRSVFGFCAYEICLWEETKMHEDHEHFLEICSCISEKAEGWR